LYRKAEKGHVTGKPTFGYNYVPVEAINGNGETTRSHSEYAINEEESQVIKNIFQMYRDGIGFKKIAKVMNGDTTSNHTNLLIKYFDGVLPKRGKANKKPWSHPQVRAILHNEKYIGVITYGKRQNAYKSGSKTTIKNDDFVTVIKPELRIIPEALWDAVQNRLNEVAQKYTNSRGGNVPFTGSVINAADSKFLLSGLCICDECGHSYVTLGGTVGCGENRKNKYKYGCSGYHNKGNQICTNNHTIYLDQLDADVVSQIRLNLLTEDKVTYIVNKALEIIKDNNKSSPDVVTKLIKEESKTSRDIEQLIQLVLNNGVNSEQVSSKINEKESRKLWLKDEIKRLNDIKSAESFNPKDIQRKLNKRMNEFDNLMSSNVSDARKVLKHLLSEKIRISPTINKGTRTTRFTGNTHAGRLMEPIDEDDHIGLICSI